MFKKVIELIEKYESIVICTHVNADGDTICSALALKEILVNHFQKKVYISGERYPKYFDGLEPNDSVSDELFNKSLVIVLDVTGKDRIFDKRVVTKESIKIDHHPSQGEWLESVVDTNSPATGQLIYQFAQAVNFKLTEYFKELIYISIWTDTDGLLNRNITDQTLRVVEELRDVKNNALKRIVLPIEIQTLFNQLLCKVNCNNTKCILQIDDNFEKDYIRLFVAYVFKEKIYSSENKSLLAVFKVNENEFLGELRSKSGVDVSKFAVKWGGGGHVNSSGFRVSNFEKIAMIIEDFKTQF